ncbi:MULTISPECIES: hypothetical protein [Rufibacter]|uniref:Uncharacterized protein n=1 Tax=Rufibacter quisquiliarum TaxID=1549639 RepID=A0A839GLX7_9BACT|nr:MULTISPECIES: hypothetical protein [Rufibacter]MBA9078843.1 hypothetical protein [Rufibacter quisquiliarum]
MTKGKGEDSPKQNRPEQDRSWQEAQSQNDHLNNSNRHNNNPPYDGSPETRSNPNTQGSQNQKSQNNQRMDTGAGVSGRPNNVHNHNPGKGHNAPNFQDGPVPGGADNTRGENVSHQEGHGGGAKRAKADLEQDSPQGSNANWSDTRGADSTDKEFRNNQPNASTLKGHKESADGLGNEKE